MNAGPPARLPITHGHLLVQTAALSPVHPEAPGTQSVLVNLGLTELNQSESYSKPPGTWQRQHPHLLNPIKAPQDSIEDVLRASLVAQ